jgi:WD40 repeat protein
LSDLGSDTPVRELAIDVISERIIPCPEGFIPVPDRPHEQIGWGSTRLGRNAGGELRALVDKKVVFLYHALEGSLTSFSQVVHVVEAAYTTCAAFADSETLATGSSDYIVRLWRVERTPLSPKDPPLSITLTNIMRGHTAEVLCIAASRQWSLLVSGSSDGTAIFWELNRGTYTRSLFHDLEDRDPVTLVAINESTVS